VSTTRDTSPEVARELVRIFRSMTPERRLALALEMSDDVRSVWEAGMRDRASREVAGPLGKSAAADPGRASG